VCHFFSAGFNFRYLARSARSVFDQLQSVDHFGGPTRAWRSLLGLRLFLQLRYKILEVGAIADRIEVRFLELVGQVLAAQAREQGLAVVALGALCHHNLRGIGLLKEFYDSAAVFARKWSHRLPVATPRVIIDRRGCVHPLGEWDQRWDEIHCIYSKLINNIT
jgi:hypothetical protein